MKKNIFWFRRDLRIDDNTALNAALNSKDPVIAIFIFDNQIVDSLPKNDARINFIYSQLKSIDSLLKSYGSSLLVFKGNPCDIFAELISKYNINCVFSNKDYEPYALNRDKK